MAMLVCTLALAGCARDEPQPQPGDWVRVEQVAGQTYFIAHANTQTGMCVYLRLDALDPELGMPSTSEHEIKGAEDFWVVTAYAREDWARRCTTGFNDSDASAAVSGRIEFEDLLSTGEDTVHCTLSYALTIDGSYETPEGRVEVIHEVAAEAVPVMNELCPRPQVYRAEHTQLEAAYGEREGVGNLVLSTWDEQREICVIARFLNASGAVAAPSAVEAPGEWTYSGLRFASVGAEGCRASQLIDPPLLSTYPDDTLSVGPMFSTGSLEFGALGGGGVPCSLDADLLLQSTGRYYWAPEDTLLRGESVAVSGCD